MNGPPMETRPLVGVTQISVFLFDASGLVFQSNRHFLERHGLSALPDEPDAWLAAVFPDDRPATEASWQSARDDSRPVNLEYRLVGADGRTRWVETHLVPDPENSTWTGTTAEASPRRAAERGLREVMVATAGKTGVEFFRALVPTLAHALGSSCAAVSEVRPERRTHAKVLALWADGDFVEPFEYELAGTPCEDVVRSNGETCFIPQDVAAAYPDDTMLADMGADAYLGIPLWGRAGQTLGLLSVIDDRPMHGREHAIEIMRVFASQAGMELERLDAENSVAESEERFRLLAENVPAVIYVRSGGSGRELLYLNDQVEEQTGWPKDAFMEGRIDPSELHHPEDANWLPRAVAAAIENQRPFHLVYRIRHRDGSWRWLEEHGAGIFRDGRLHLIEGFVSDITDRKRAEEEIRDSFARYRAMFEENWAIKLVVDPASGAILDANEAACTFYERSRDVLLATNVREIESGADDSPPPTSLENTHHFSKHCLPSGETRDVEIWSGPIEIEGSRVMFAIIHDVTERKRLEKETRRLEVRVRQAQKLESLGVLAGGIAHDFNNLLVGILGNVGIAQLDLPETSTVRPLLDEIENAAHRASDLSRQMLAYSGKGRFTVDALGLNQLVEEMAHLLEASISKRAKLSFDFAADLPAVVGDATQIRQIVMNLITNASDALDESDGTIRIRTTTKRIESQDDVDTTWRLEPGPFAVLEVADTGHGMDDATVDRIFEPFFTTKFTGRGLGLAAVLGIVRAHHGGISIDSAPGVGTTFRILLPADESQVPSSAAPPRPARARSGAGVVLVVDDEPAVRRMAQACLERHGFEVLIAEDGERAIEVFEENRDRVRAVLLDMTMPKLDGEGTFTELRRRRADLPVVLTSGYAEPELLRRSAHGKAKFIQKPYRAADLIDTLLGLF